MNTCVIWNGNFVAYVMYKICFITKLYEKVQILLESEKPGNQLFFKHVFAFIKKYPASIS